MASRKYASDYRLESHILPDGKVESVPVYQGKYFTFIESPAQIRHLRKVLSIGSALVLLLLIPMLLDNTRLGRTIYIVLPAVFTFVPLYMLVASVLRLGHQDDPFTREQRDKTDKRIHNGCMALVVILAVSCAGCVIHFIINGIAANEILCAVSLFGALIVSVLLLPYRKLARTEEISQ